MDLNSPSSFPSQVIMQNNMAAQNAAAARSKITGLPLGVGAAPKTAAIGARPKIPAAAVEPQPYTTTDAIEYLKSLFGFGENSRQNQLNGILGQLGATRGGAPVKPAVGATPGQ